MLRKQKWINRKVENIRKEKGDINKNQMKILELKNTATKIKYSLYELNGRMQMTEEIAIDQSI